MEHTTYEDPAVVELIGASFLAVKVDQDARPDISARYEDYGWPATIIFDGAGTELVKFRGYIPPPRMRSLLAAIVADPTPGPSAAPAPAITAGEQTALGDELRARLLERWAEGYDREHGGWGTIHKFIDPAALELALRRARDGDEHAEAMARTTLANARRLFDPAWGGVYQYSHGGVWDNPHFEKIMPLQTANLRSYALAFAQWGEPEHRDACAEVFRYLRDHLRRDDGAFFTSQDADLVRGEHAEGYFALDDEARRARGVPAIDEHVYARENGWAIRALCLHHAATGEAAPLEAALAAAEVIVAERALPGGGFRHGAADDPAGPYLDDTLAMGRAFLALYEVTADRRWLARAMAAADFIDARFVARDGDDEPAPGVLSASPRHGAALAPVVLLDQNVAVARFANLLHRYGGDDAHRRLAEHAMRWLATPAVALSRRVTTAGMLLADAELRADPIHVTVVAGKTDATAAALQRAALRAPTTYRRIEWLDRAEGPLPNDDVPYPDLEGAAAFLCADGACSPPLRDAAQIARRLAPK